MFKFIFQDFKFNNNIKSKFILLSFRLCQILIKNRFLTFIFFPILLFHRIIIEWFMGTELNWNLKINGKLKLFHGQGLIINPSTIFGDGCTVRCNTVIGNNGKDKNAPILGNNVDIGVNCCIIGNIKIGDDVIIGAGTVITKDIPSNVVVVGNPAKIIKTNIKMSDYV
jgi:putative colanic acid biosynthesis acetyltransferase WcaB